MIKLYFFVALFFYQTAWGEVSETQSISPSCLTDFNTNSSNAQQLIKTALDLTQQHLKYQYGSADPAAGGLDCSGTIYYLLNKMGIEAVPRSSEGLYQWVLKNKTFHQVAADSIEDSEFAYLKPGDLLFWSGTYKAANNPCATHVMLYLGKDKHNNPLMVGSSDGRTYQGKQIYGMSIFDFKLAKSRGRSKFLGYSCIPTFTCAKIN